MSVLVLGSINTDLVIRGQRLPAPGETVLGGSFFQAQGGKGANQAVAAARLARSPVTFIAAVGDDAFGRAALESLAAENLRTEFIQVVPGEATGMALILVDAEGQNLISVASGANVRLRREVVRDLPESVYTAANVFLVSLESPLDTVFASLHRAKQAGLKTIVNPAPADLAFAGLGGLALVDVLVPNESEAAALTERPVETVEDAIAAGQTLRARGAGACIVTLGARGAAVVEETATVIPPLPVQAVDATAAGDCFCGALAVALSEGRPLVEAARWANQAAALSVSRAGAQPSLPRRGELDQPNER
jgi:ribokinase